jgi:hypothetical protein
MPVDDVYYRYMRLRAAFNEYISTYSVRVPPSRWVVGRVPLCTFSGGGWSSCSSCLFDKRFGATCPGGRVSLFGPAGVKIDSGLEFVCGRLLPVDRHLKTSEIQILTSVYQPLGACH